MAAFQGSAVSAAEIALSAATAKTVLMITAPANHRVRLLGWSVAFDSTNPTAEPVQVELCRYSAAGTFTSLTPAKRDPSLAETLQVTAGHTATVEPSGTTTVIDSLEVHPQMGYEKVYAWGQELLIEGGGRLGIRCTAPAAVNCRAKLDWEE